MAVTAGQVLLFFRRGGFVQYAVEQRLAFKHVVVLFHIPQVCRGQKQRRNFLGGGVGQGKVGKIELRFGHIRLKLDHYALAALVHVPLVFCVFVDKQHVFDVGHVLFAFAEVGGASCNLHCDGIGGTVVASHRFVVVFVDCVYRNNAFQYQF